MADPRVVALWPQGEPESVRRLQLLKDKIQHELEVETKARREETQREPLVPLSLAADYAVSHGSPPGLGKLKGGSRGTRGAAGPGGLKEPSPADAAANSSQAAIATAREKIASMKLDKWVQRELEAELDKQSSETSQLKSQNARLRDIVALRQESNARREERMQQEIGRLNQLCDEACVDMNDMDQTMEGLREMNRKIQDGADRLKTSIEERAEADRLQLTRNYRVKIREVRQLLEEQRARNDRGAKALIDRHRQLEADRDRAAESLRQLEVRNERLEVLNSELEVTLKHQGEQREGMTARVAVVKRENKRLQNHIDELEAQHRTGDSLDRSREGTMHGTRSTMGKTQPASFSPNTTTEKNRPDTKQGATNPANRPPVGKTPLNVLAAHTATSERRLPQSAALLAAKHGQTQAAGRAARSQAVSDAQSHQAGLKHLRGTLERIRRNLRRVRSAHVELLQERTELEVFVRQCMEDVRRDMYRFTIIGGHHAGPDRQLENYTADERRQLLAVLQSKLRVLATLHAHMFPAKAAAGQTGDGMHLALRDEAGLAADDVRALDRAMGIVKDDREKQRLAAYGGGHLPFSTEVPQDDTVDEAVEALWDKWRKWTATTGDVSSIKKPKAS